MKEFCDLLNLETGEIEDLLGLANELEQLCQPGAEPYVCANASVKKITYRQD